MVSNHETFVPSSNETIRYETKRLYVAPRTFPDHGLGRGFEVTFDPSLDHKSLMKRRLFCGKVTLELVVLPHLCCLCTTTGLSR
jgi:hypothetical protein